MTLKRKHQIIIGGTLIAVVIGLVVGVTVGVVVGRRKPQSFTIETRSSHILDNNPLIDG